MAVHYVAYRAALLGVHVLSDEYDRDRKAAQNGIDEMRFGLGRPDIAALKSWLQLQFVPLIPGEKIVYAVTAWFMATHELLLALNTVNGCQPPAPALPACNSEDTFLIPGVGHREKAKASPIFLYACVARKARVVACTLCRPLKVADSHYICPSGSGQKNSALLTRRF